MRLVPYLVSMAIALVGIIVGIVLLSRKQTQQAITVFVSAVALSGAVVALWRV